MLLSHTGTVEKSQRLKEAAEARKKNPKLAKNEPTSREKELDSGKVTQEGRGPHGAITPKVVQGEDADSGDKRILGVRELVLPLPHVWPGRGPEPKKGCGAITR